eukprot:Nitzschia sp. Nitz4//scaffold203_size38902//27012//28606//NITZ4_007664-RA/size38902-augustus-gene-0.49-mRNA-1//-1//CDS//3329541436//7538//frame0
MSGQEEPYNPGPARDSSGDYNRNSDSDRHRGYRTSDLRRRDGDDGRRFTENIRRNEDRNYGPPMRSDRDRRYEPPPYNRDGGRQRSEDPSHGGRWDQPRFSGDDPSRYRDRDRDQGRYARHPPRERDREYYDDYDDYDGRRPSRSRPYPPDRYRDSMDHPDDDHYRRGRQYSPSRSDSPPRRDRSRSNAADMEEPRLPRKKVIEWPPCFEKDGSAFVFHPASGTFYEEQSDFYYDPKTKLYYGVQKQAYYRYEENDKGEPPFVETQKAQASEGTPALPVELAVTQPSGISGTSMDTQKPMIAINLKTKKMKKPKHTSGTPSATPPPPTKAQKEQAANIDKWNEKQAELKNDSIDATAPSVVRRTVKGDPVCLVCRRKFASVEKLRLHEEKSELHRSNLAKQQQETNDKKRAEPPEYHDRAEKRRQLHAPSTIRVPTEEEPVSVEPEREALDESHIGNRMLQKMGWKQGANLGSKGDDATNTTGTAVDHLRKDWDRIEAMASQQQR